MPRFTIGPREFQTPVLVPSVSSYETQISPNQALLIQSAISEPISLASAFDVRRYPDSLASAVSKFRERGGILLLDSGGYESHRYNRFASIDEKKAAWSFEAFREEARRVTFDLAFSFDEFPTAGSSPSEYVDRLLELLAAHGDFIPQDKLIPVVHLITRDGQTAFDGTASLEVFRLLADRWQPDFVAVPERELGIGVTTRAVHARKICKVLTGSRCKMHALGCGNPLSVALLGVAGVAIMDGLEWCRTVVAPENTHLHHFQQLEVFAADLSEQDPVAAMMYASTTDYVVRTALHNLTLIRDFMARLTNAGDSQRVNAFLTPLYGQGVIKALEAIERA